MGGAAGHMNHPFDCPDVETGLDLIAFFENVADWVIKNPAAVKIDGVNCSFKLVDNNSTHSFQGKEFAVDRGSSTGEMGDLDRRGITHDKAVLRWPKRNPQDAEEKSHGMIAASQIILSVFNKALPSIKNELVSLGMWDDETIFLNTEFVLKKTNVKEYIHNFVAIHGVNKFYQATPKRRASIEIPYDESVLKALAKKVAPVASKVIPPGDSDGFKIYTSIPTTSISRPEFNEELEKLFPVILNRDAEGEEVEERSLRSWLEEAVNPRHYMIKLVGGGSAGALSKKVYMNILDGMPISEFIERGEDVKSAIYGAVFYHTTRVLGHVVLESLESELGPASEEEGIVVRDPKICSSGPVKITGEFIIGGMESSFRTAPANRDDDQMYEPVDAPAVEAFEGQIDSDLNVRGYEKIALLPGGFKPPHRGHLALVQQFAGITDMVYILMGDKVRSAGESTQIGFDLSKKIWDMYLDDAGLTEGEDYTFVQHKMPMRRAYEILEKETGPGQTVLMGASTKDADRFGSDIQDMYAPSGVTVVIQPLETTMHSLTGEQLSARFMRSFISSGNYNEFVEYVPETSKHRSAEIWGLLGGHYRAVNPTEPLSEFNAAGGYGAGRSYDRDRARDVYRTANKVTSAQVRGMNKQETEEEEELEETSGMAAGAVTGYSGGSGRLNSMSKRDDEDEENDPRNKSTDGPSVVKEADYLTEEVVKYIFGVLKR